MAREEKKVRVYLVNKRYGKFVTTIEGISRDVDVRNVLRELKTRLACGGTFKNDSIELQGDHKEKVKAILVRMGFPADKIEVS
jgi:translation initiation factor 1